MLGPGLLLLPAIENTVFQKGCCKRYACVMLGPSCLEMVFALLIEIIAFYFQIVKIEIWVPSLEKPI